MNKERSSGISAVIGIVILILLVLVLSAGVLFAAQTLVGDQPQQMVGGMTEERVSPYEQRVSLVSQGNADDLTIVSPLGTEYNLSQVGDSQLYLAVSSSVSGAQDPQILGVKNGERQVLTSSEIQDGIPADIVVDKHGTGEYTSIRNALNNTNSGDIVVVEKATYNENIDVPKNVSLIAEHGTVIQDQNPAEPVVFIENGNATVMNFVIDADPVKGDNHYASHGILVRGKNTEVIGNTIRNATSPAGDSAGLRVESEGVVARYNNFKNNEFSLSVSSGVDSVQLCSNQLDGGLHGSFSKTTYETFVMRNYWNKGVPSTVLNNVLSDRPNVTATDVSRNAVNFNKVFETSNDQEILAAKAFPGTRLFGGAPCGIQLSFTNQGGSVDVVNASISYEVQNVTYNVTFNDDYTATLVRGNNSTTTSYSVSGGDTSWDTGESLSLASPDSGSSDTSGVWSSGGGGGGGASFWGGGGTGGGLSGGSLSGGSGGSFWGVSSGTTSSDVKVTKSPTDTTASVEQSPPDNVTETEKQNVTVDLGADFKATVGDEISLDAVVTGGSSPYNYTWTLGDGTTSYSKSVTHIYSSTGNYTISLNVTDANGQNDTDSITVWIQESTTTTTTKNESLTLNEQVSNLSAGETLVIPSGSYSAVNVNVPGVTLVGDGSVTINGLSILSDNVKLKNVEVTGPLSITGSDYSMYDSTIDNTGGAWAIEVHETGAYFDGVTGEANNGMYVARALQDIQFTSGSLTANSGQSVLVKKHTGIVEITDSSITATGAGIYREHGSQLYLARNSISGSPDVERIPNEPPQPVFTYNDAPLDNGNYGVKFDPSSTTDPESEPITSMKWDFNNDGIIDAYGDGVKQYTYPDYGTYNVTLSVTDYHGTTVRLTREITINEYYFAVSTNKFTANTSEPVKFNATKSVPDSNIDHYNMDYDGDGTAEEQVNSLPVTHTYTTAGDYSPQIELVTTNSGALVNSTTIQILAPPTATFTMNSSSTSPDKNVRFDASGSTDPDGGPISYEWDFGDGTIATGESLTHSYSNAGDYTVSLTVTDDEGETSTVSKVISITSSSTAPSDGLVAYWTLNGSVTDSASNNDGSTHGATFASGHIGEAAKFDGSNDYITIPEDSSFDPGGKSEWTMSAWLLTNSPGTNQCWSGMGDSEDPYDFCIESGSLQYKWQDGFNSMDAASGTSPTKNTWFHITVVYDGENVTGYYNGAVDAVLHNQGSAYSSSSPLYLGDRKAQNTPWDGKIDEVRIYDRALSKSEIQSLYASGDTPPTANFTYSPSKPITGESISFDASNSSDSGGSIASYEWDFDGDGTIDATGSTTSHTYSTTGSYTVNLTVTDNNGNTVSTTKSFSVENVLQQELSAHYKLDGDATDATGAHDGVIVGSPSSTQGVVDSAMLFDGSNDYINIPHSYANDFGSSSFAVSSWFKTTNQNGNLRIVDNRHENHGFVGFVVLLDSGKPTMWIDDGSTNEIAYKTSNSYADGSWHHIVAMRDNNADTLRIFIDGTEKSLNAIDGGSASSYGSIAHSAETQIGAEYLDQNSPYTAGYFDGKLDDTRLYNKALSNSEIQLLYDKGNTPPTADFTVSPSSPVTGETASFDGSYSSDSIGSIDSYKWDFDGDGTTDATGQTTSYTFSSTGDYDVTLTVTDDDGASDSKTQTVTVKTQPVVWESASDWDNATNEYGVAHESIQNTGHNNASILRKGYSISQPSGSASLAGYWPLQETGTNNVYDFARDNDASSVNSVTSETGILGTPSHGFDGSNSKIEISDRFISGTPFSVCGWFTSEDGSGDEFIVGRRGGSTWDIQVRLEGGTLNGWIKDSNGAGRNVVGNSVSTGSWNQFCMNYDGATLELYQNGASQGTTSGSGLKGTDYKFTIGARSNNMDYFEGNISEVRFYNTTLSASEVQYLYNVVDAKSTLTTNNKTFSSPTKPDLTNLSYDLNQQSLKITVIGSPNTTNEETHTVAMDGQSNYNIQWNNAHTKFKLKIALSTTSPTKTPTVNKVQLSG